MKSNPGGQLDPSEIFGRDQQIERLWEILQGRCVYMNDLRRIGKTQIMVKMASQPKRGWICVKRDLGRFHTAEEFARQAFEDSAAVLTGGKRAMRRMTDLLDQELADLNNDWDLEHYHNRLAEYYHDDAGLAAAILDAVAISRSMTFDKIRSSVSNRMQVDDETLRRVLKLLCKDHYLDHSANGTYAFYLIVVARWWRIARDLREDV